VEYSKNLFIKVIRKLRENFVYSIKTGPRDPLIKKNGETFIRYPKQMKKLTRDNYSPAVDMDLIRFWRLSSIYLVWRRQFTLINRVKTNSFVFIETN
jgi:hypothetical protein